MCFALESVHAQYLCVEPKTGALQKISIWQLLQVPPRSVASASGTHPQKQRTLAADIDIRKGTVKHPVNFDNNQLYRHRVVRYSPARHWEDKH